jgi:hypothetical protein
MPVRVSAAVIQPFTVALRQINPTGKILFYRNPKSVVQLRRPVPARGAVARRHERGMGCGGRDSVGAPLNLVSDLQVRDERRFSVRQNRVVLTPVAGAKSAVAGSNPTGSSGRCIRRRR